jgi:PAS domain-containing protein
MRQERKNSDKALDDGIEPESRLRHIVNRTPAVICSARPDGYIDFLNQQCLEFGGLSFEEMSGWDGPRQFIRTTLKELAKWRTH